MLILTSKGELIFEEENCLDVSKSYAGAPVEILKCHGMGGNQKWEHDKKSVSLHTTASFCYSCVAELNESWRIYMSSDFPYLYLLHLSCSKFRTIQRDFLLVCQANDANTSAELGNIMYRWNEQEISSTFIKVWTKEERQGCKKFRSRSIIYAPY